MRGSPVVLHGKVCLGTISIKFFAGEMHAWQKNHVLPWKLLVLVHSCLELCTNSQNIDNSVVGWVLDTISFIQIFLKMCFPKNDQYYLLGGYRYGLIKDRLHCCHRLIACCIKICEKAIKRE